MIVYRDLQRSVRAQELLPRLGDALAAQMDRERPDHDRVTGLLVEFGELESALCDSLMPDADNDIPAVRALRGVALGLGHLLRRSWYGGPAPDQSRALHQALIDLRWRVPLPAAPLRVAVPEGFAFYGLYPETYLEAAEKFARERAPGSAVCIGLRSIGTALSAVVAAALEARGWQVWSHTLRPRGEPFARSPVLAPGLRQQLQARARGYALVVDEGPGLSGSSFAGTARLLEELGYERDRIVLFPSWDPDARTLCSAEAQLRWTRHARYLGDFHRIWVDSGRLAPVPLRPLDGGAWRGLFFPEHRFPPVQPQHERRKFITLEPAPRLLKFAGLGPYGEAARQRAELLSAAGYVPPVESLRHGFIAQRFVAARPLAADQCSAALIETVARYLAYLQRAFPAAQATPAEQLAAMVAHNVGEAFGSVLAELRRDDFAQGPAVQLDGRMQPWEWLDTGTGYLKADALDHYRDHFFPGATDIAWDLAAFITEFRLEADGSELLLRRFVRHSGDTGIARRLPLWRLAYAACRVGYTALAAETTAGSAEASRFRRLHACYRRQLQRALVTWRQRAQRA